jgi:hypothetical protein
MKNTSIIIDNRAETKPKRKYVRKNAPAAAPAQPLREVIAAATEVIAG